MLRVIKNYKRKEIIGEHTLYLGDCLEVMAELEAGSIDAVVTDPPYGNNTAMSMGGMGGMWAGVGILGDESTQIRDDFLQTFNGPFAVLASPRNKPPNNIKCMVVWEKGGHTGAGDLKLPWKPNFDFVYIGGQGWHSEKRESGVIRINAVGGCVGIRNDGHKWHPFEKPVELMAHFCVRAPGKTILDPFMGSGSTGIACIELGRKFIGIEKVEEYFETACSRIKRANMQIPLLTVEE